jgi:hypothetical protein
MARLIVLVQRPYHLSTEEADHWIRGQVAALAKDDAVRRVDLTLLQSVAPGCGRGWDWLIELHCDRGQDASRAAASSAWRELLADLRQLGMRPSVVLADQAAAVHG